MISGWQARDCGAVAADFGGEGTGARERSNCKGQLNSFILVFMTASSSSNVWSCLKILESLFSAGLTE
jgi:hypothetical protein